MVRQAHHEPILVASPMGYAHPHPPPAFAGAGPDGHPLPLAGEAFCAAQVVRQARHERRKRTKNAFNSTPAVKAAKIAGCLSHACAPSLRGFAVFHAETTLDHFRCT
jgi:hypothetical protein